jgi:dienelactone hydrolase
MPLISYRPTEFYEKRIIMTYREDTGASESAKKEYLDSILKIIEGRQSDAEKRRKDHSADIFKNPEKYRAELREMLGWPLVDHADTSLPRLVKSEPLAYFDGYEVSRMTFEVLDGLKISGLFFKADVKEKRPLVILQHGGGGTPELIASFYGDTYNYNDMLHRVRRKGVHVFAPQLLLWSDDYNVNFDRKVIDARLKRVGSSISAIEIYSISRIIDYFEVCDFVSGFGMVGLSYGGFYTLFTAAIDTRIASSISCSYFNSRDLHKSAFTDWTWKSSAELFDDAEVACLCYPRHICLQMGDRDELFAKEATERSFKKIEELASKVGTSWVDLVIFEGNHEFCRDDTPIDRLIQDLGL